MAGLHTPNLPQINISDLMNAKTSVDVHRANSYNTHVAQVGTPLCANH